MVAVLVNLHKASQEPFSPWVKKGPAKGTPTPEPLVLRSLSSSRKYLLQETGKADDQKDREMFSWIAPSPFITALVKLCVWGTSCYSDS